MNNILTLLRFGIGIGNNNMPYITQYAPFLKIKTMEIKTGNGPVSTHQTHTT